jgi:RimJ/RimL family protein N-acetyltransferase
MGLFREIELDEVELSGPRTLLRPWRAEDAPAVHTALQPDRMRRYLTVPSPYSPAHAKQFVGSDSHQSRAVGSGLEVAIEDLQSGELLGSAAIRLPLGVLDSADVGYWIAPQAQGHGYAAEAVRVLADWALAAGVSRVEVRCEPTNLASARTAMNAGHRFESYRNAEMVIGGRKQDMAVFVRTDAAIPESPVAPRFVALPAGGLGDGVITLRPTVPADTREMIELESDATTIEVSFSGIRQDDAEIGRMTERAGLDWLVGQIARMSVVDIATGAVAGAVQIRLAGPPHVGGIGYGVHPAFRGRGYTARALRLLAEWAFAEGRFARLELGAKHDNIASQRAAASGGFEPDGVRRARLRNPDGTFSDEVRFALVAPQYR